MVCSPAAHLQEPRLADGPAGGQPVVDAAGGGAARPALHHPHLHGPADHRRHHQPQGAQA